MSYPDLTDEDNAIIDSTERHIALHEANSLDETGDISFLLKGRVCHIMYRDPDGQYIKLDSCAGRNWRDALIRGIERAALD